MLNTIENEKERPKEEKKKNIFKGQYKYLISFKLATSSCFDWFCACIFLDN